MNSNFVSIIIPAYNAQKTIKKCLHSLLNLDFDKDKYEIIVVDNNSSDQTESFIKSFESVIYLKELTQGRSFARNAGAKIARGNLLAFIDSDVVLDPLWLKSLVEKFNKESIGGGQGRIIPSNDDGQVSLNKFRIRQQSESTFNSNIILKLMYAESPMVNSAACMYRKEAFHFVGGFDVLLERHEDIDLAKRVCVAGFDLVAESRAIAHVEYHAEGWWSYFIRSFSEGKTKQSYNSKWLQYFSTIHTPVAVAPTNTVSVEKNYALSALKLNLQMFADEIIFNMIRGCISFDSYFFLKAINSSFKTVGRVWGILTVSYPGQFKPRYRQELLLRSIFLKNDAKVEIDHNIRFVIENDEILYALNIEKNEILNFDNFHTFRAILNQRTLNQEIPFHE